MNVADYMARQWGPQPCWEMLSTVIAENGGAIPLEFRTINRSVREMASEFRLALFKGNHGYAEIAAPENMCVVLLGKSDRLGITHCGVYQDGSVLHAIPGAVLFEELTQIRDRFEVAQFWAKA